MKWVLDLLGRFAPLRHVVDYRLVEKESVHQCPACKADVHESSIPFARLDRYGFPVTTSWCQRCDLLYVSPRPTPVSYTHLKTGRLAGAAIDVMAGETSGNPNWLEGSGLYAYARDNSNLLITPHIGGVTYESVEKTNCFIIEKLARYLGNDASSQINAIK